MRYPRNLRQCPHCAGLDNEELAMFKKRRETELDDIAGLGKVFIVLAALLLIFTGYLAIPNF